MEECVEYINDINATRICIRLFCESYQDIVKQEISFNKKRKKF